MNIYDFACNSRVFYETLLAQRPDSEMAQEWCLAYGIMDEGDARKVAKRLLKRKESSGGGKNPSAKSGGTSGKKKKKSSKKKRVLDDVEFDAGMDAGGGDGIGVAAL